MISERAIKLYESAVAHNGRHLLPQRYRKPKPWQEPSELDRDYDACDELVDGGFAMWLRTRMSPGIELTGKPIDAAKRTPSSSI